jgi:hypothetical protein
MAEVPLRNSNQITVLSEQSQIFLYNLAEIANRECDIDIRSQHDSESTLLRANNNSPSSSEDEFRKCTLTSEALKHILCVFPPEMEHPWKSPPLFKVNLFWFPGILAFYSQKSSCRSFNFIVVETESRGLAGISK